jgi:hypothetical protein
VSVHSRSLIARANRRWPTAGCEIHGSGDPRQYPRTRPIGRIVKPLFTCIAWFPRMGATGSAILFESTTLAAVCTSLHTVKSMPRATSISVEASKIALHSRRLRSTSHRVTGTFCRPVRLPKRALMPRLVVGSFPTPTIPGQGYRGSRLSGDQPTKKRSLMELRAPLALLACVNFHENASVEGSYDIFPFRIH